MSTRMLINAIEKEEFRIAIVKDGRLEEFYIETATQQEKVGNIYIGVVEHVEPSLQACFVDFGGERNGFLPINEIHPEYYSNSLEHKSQGSYPAIEKVVKKGQPLLVQVTKEMPGHKGPQLTTYLSLASRYLVLMPGGAKGISKKIEDETERRRLRKIMEELNIPDGIGYVVRTAAYKQSKRELSKDLTRLIRLWNKIKREAKKKEVPSLLHKEQDICLRVIRDYFTSEILEIWVDDVETFHEVKNYMKIISPRHQKRVKLYKEDIPLFAYYGIEKEIEAIYSNRVSLRSGGYIVIEPTEALISIDVNSGSAKAKDPQATAFKINMEAAAEIARQLRLRDIGGLVVIDFIDMKNKKHIMQVEKELKNGLKNDRAKINMLHISSLGLLELSRQRIRPSVEMKSYQICRYCNGRGLVQSVESAAVSFLRKIKTLVHHKEAKRIKGVIPKDVASYMLNTKKAELLRLESKYGVSIFIEPDPSLPPGGGDVKLISDE